MPEEYFRNIHSPLGQGIPDDKEYGEVVLYDEQGHAILDKAGWSHDGDHSQQVSLRIPDPSNKYCIKNLESGTKFCLDN